MHLDSGIPNSFEWTTWLVLHQEAILHVASIGLVCVHEIGGLNLIIGDKHAVGGSFIMDFVCD
jgi:hypothetical protein